MTEAHKTLGQQVIDVQTKYAGQKTQTVRETTTEMGKKYMESLWKTVEMHNGYNEDYYIMEILKPDGLIEGVINLKHIARKTRPKPEWGVSLYKVRPSSGLVTYEWGLPSSDEAFVMVQNPEGWDSKLIKDIKDFVEGKLE